VGNYVDSYLEYLVKGGVLFGHGKLIDMFNGLLTSIDKYTNNNGWYIWVNKDNGKMTLPYFEALDAYWPGLLSLVGRVKQARLTNFNHFLVWKSLGTLPEILHIVNGVPTKGYEAYHLRPGSDGSP
jgi:mannosidase alpha-like ER degradation enhancer 2